MQTFTFEANYPDDGGSRADMVIAPDRDTARRLAAVQTLEDNGWTLASRGSESLLSFYDGSRYEPGDHMDVHAEWGDLKGTACPNCTSHNGQHNGGIHAWTTGQAKVFECSACGYTWVPLGFGVKRKILEAAARDAIAGLKEYEQKSLAADPVDDA
jgi:Zn ribbon nucleic-acid-binding protein